MLCQRLIVNQNAVAPDVHGVISQLLARDPKMRGQISAILNAPGFADINIKALRFLEALSEKDEAQRVQFLRGLGKLLADGASPLSDPRVLRERVLPPLCDALLFPSLVSEVGPHIITCLQRGQLEPTGFQATVWPQLKGIFTARDVSIQMVRLLVENLEVLLSLVDSKGADEVLMPFFLKCRELPEESILDEAIRRIPAIQKRFDYRQVKDLVLPRLLQIMSSTGTVRIRVHVIMGLNAMFETFDKSTLQDQILGAFEKLSRVDRSPAVCMSLLSACDALSKSLGPKVTAERLLPMLMPFLVEESLGKDDWHTQVSVIKKLLQRVEQSREKELQSQVARQAETNAALGAPPAPAAPPPPMDFESLLMGTPAPPPAPAVPAASGAAPSF